MRRIVIMGAGGRDFHDFATVFRDDPSARVVAFTAAQIPGIADRVYPASLAGPSYPQGIPILAEERLAELITREKVDEVVFAYSDLSHLEVMHRASIAMSAGADFRLVGPKASQLHSCRPVVAVCAVRTGCGKSQTSRHVGRMLTGAGLRVALVRHPMPYGDLERMRVQRFATLADIDASAPTVEEREEYESAVQMNLIMFAGVDYAQILQRAEAEADVVIWDGGNNDFPFYAPDVLITVVDPLRPGHETSYHPGEVNLRMADIVVVNKVDTASPEAVDAVIAAVARVNPRAVVVRAASPVTLEPGPPLTGRRVLVIEDGPTSTHGGMPHGAGTVAARAAGATHLVDPRPFAVGSIADAYEKYPSIGTVLPAMGYGPAQLDDLGATVRASACDVVVVGTPFDLTRIVDLGHPVRRATYEYRDAGSPSLSDALGGYLQAWTARVAAAAPVSG